MNTNYQYKNKKNIFKVAGEWGLTIIIASIIALFIVSNIVSITQIKEQSMETTFKEDERIIVNKVIYFIEKPSRGDVVILNKVNDEKGLIINMINEGKDILSNIKYRFTGNIEKNNLIKRVIGIEGDIIDIKDGYVYLNGQKLQESYTSSLTFQRSNLDYPVEVPSNKLFVLGDNRENSLDSRDFGFVDINQIKGKTVFRVFPFNRFGSIE